MTVRWTLLRLRRWRRGECLDCGAPKSYFWGAMACWNPAHAGIRVAKWISYDEAEEKEHSCGGLGGWFSEGHTWADFIGSVNPEATDYYEAIKESVLASGRYLGGDEHQTDPRGVPLFSDGTVGTFTYRAWGDLMAAIATINDGPVHNYMHFYMGGVISRPHNVSEDAQ